MCSYGHLRLKKKNNWETVKNYIIILHLYIPVELTDNRLTLKLVSEKWKERREHVEKSNEVWWRAFQKAGYIYSESLSYPESYYFGTTTCSIQSNMICKQWVSGHFNTTVFKGLPECLLDQSSIHKKTSLVFSDDCHIRSREVEKTFGEGPRNDDHFPLLVPKILHCLRRSSSGTLLPLPSLTWSAFLWLPGALTHTLSATVLLPSTPVWEVPYNSRSLSFPLIYYQNGSII